MAQSIPVATTAANEAPVSAVTWSAVFAGGVVAAAVSIILLLLGSSFGFAAISPWPEGTGGTIAAFGVGAAIWLVVVQWVASGLGGYVTGRLRTKWVGVHTDEVFFRDTAHGFLAWAVGTLFVAALIVMSIAGVARTAVDAAATVAAGAAEGAGAAAGGLADNAYFTDRLFRVDPAAPGAFGAGADDGAARVAEAGRILARGVLADEFPEDDRVYLVDLVADQTGLPANEAEVRVNEVIAGAQEVKAEAAQVAEDAADAAASLAIYTFLSLLVGAFIACVAAALGGRQRDDVEVVTVRA
ncbi:MAG: hypothetical protein KIS96_02010 [Bauldia sp.]|nr:hypothetical protein [Bauldia sp.]